MLINDQLVAMLVISEKAVVAHREVMTPPATEPVVIATGHLNA